MIFYLNFLNIHICVNQYHWEIKWCWTSCRYPYYITQIWRQQRVPWLYALFLTTTGSVAHDVILNQIYVCYWTWQNVYQSMHFNPSCSSCECNDTGPHFRVLVPGHTNTYISKYWTKTSILMIIIQVHWYSYVFLRHPEQSGSKATQTAGISSNDWDKQASRLGHE